MTDMVCEKHPHLPWPHADMHEADGQCAGPGMPRAQTGIDVSTEDAEVAAEAARLVELGESPWDAEPHARQRVERRRRRREAASQPKPAQTVRKGEE